MITDHNHKPIVLQRTKSYVTCILFYISVLNTSNIAFILIHMYSKPTYTLPINVLNKYL